MIVVAVTKLRKCSFEKKSAPAVDRCENFCGNRSDAGASDPNRELAPRPNRSYAQSPQHPGADHAPHGVRRILPGELRSCRSDASTIETRMRSFISLPKTRPKR
jgi:hypothetical protein